MSIGGTLRQLYKRKKTSAGVVWHAKSHLGGTNAPQGRTAAGAFVVVKEEPSLSALSGRSSYNSAPVRPIQQTGPTPVQDDQTEDQPLRSLVSSRQDLLSHSGASLPDGETQNIEDQPLSSIIGHQQTNNDGSSTAQVSAQSQGNPKAEPADTWIKRLNPSGGHYWYNTVTGAKDFNDDHS
jgi:hypothetical protein